MVEERLNIKTPEHVSLQFNLAGLGSRGAAQIIDFILVGVMYIGIFWLALYFEDNGPLINPTLEGYVIATLIIVVFLIYWGYFFLFELFSGGRTPGKMLLGVRVVQENGSHATALSLLIRNLLRIIDILPSFYFIGMAMVFLHPKHKRVGDLVAGTLVVHERKKLKSKKRITKVEKEIEQRGLTEQDYPLDDGARESLTKREWTLLKTYVDRFPQFRYKESNEITQEVAAILFPIIGFDHQNKTVDELENILLVIYLNIREDWEFTI